MLDHLVVLPRGGLCNRLRAIASAKRLASRSGARCTVIWEWGRYDALFDDGSDWLPYAAPMEPGRLMPGYHHIRHLGRGEGGATPNRRVPVTTHPRVVVDSPYVFYAEEEPLPEHLPKPVRALLMSMLAKDPKNRPADALKLSEAAEAIRNGDIAAAHAAVPGMLLFEQTTGPITAPVDLPTAATGVIGAADRTTSTTSASSDSAGT